MPLQRPRFESESQSVKAQANVRLSYSQAGSFSMNVPIIPAVDVKAGISTPGRRRQRRNGEMLLAAKHKPCAVVHRNWSRKLRTPYIIWIPFVPVWRTDIYRKLFHSRWIGGDKNANHAHGKWTPFRHRRAHRSNWAPPTKELAVKLPPARLATSASFSQ